MTKRTLLCSKVTCIRTSPVTSSFSSGWSLGRRARDQSEGVTAQAKRRTGVLVPLVYGVVVDKDGSELDVAEEIVLFMRAVINVKGNRRLFRGDVARRRGGVRWERWRG